MFWFGLRDNWQRTGRDESVAVLCNPGAISTESLGPKLVTAITALPVPAPSYEALPQLGAPIANDPRAGYFVNQRTRARASDVSRCVPAIG